MKPAPEPDIGLVVRGFQLILQGLGVPGGPHTEETAVRAASAWYYELCQGITGKAPKITTFPSERDEMVVLRDIPLRSICAHHLLPFTGTAVVAYIPGAGRILGLSKLSRIADHCARRPQVQEELTAQIADEVARHVMENDAVRGSLGARGGVGVLVRASHMCMEMRGVNHRGDMVTSALRGIFRKPEVRDEFLRLAGY